MHIKIQFKAETDHKTAGEPEDSVLADGADSGFLFGRRIVW